MNYTGLPFTAQCYSRYFHIAANEPDVLAIGLLPRWRISWIIHALFKTNSPTPNNNGKTGGICMLFFSISPAGQTNSASAVCLTRVDVFYVILHHRKHNRKERQSARDETQRVSQTIPVPHWTLSLWKLKPLFKNEEGFSVCC